MKKKVCLLFSLIISIGLMGQTHSASVLTDTTYFKNPTYYLSKISTDKINSNILIDRVIYDSLMLNCNGRNKVTTINSTNWKDMYWNLKWANIDTSFIPDIDTISKGVKLYYKTKMIYAIGILDFSFKRIKQMALDNNELIQKPAFLYDNSATINSFSSERVIAMSCLLSNIYGDDVKFIVDDFFYLTNNTTQSLDSIEIDFDDGKGYIPIRMNDTIDVHYTSQSEFMELKFKMIFRNRLTNIKETLYANSTVYRTGTSTLPLPSLISTSHFRSANPYESKFYPRTLYYPESSHNTTTCYNWANFERPKQLCLEEYHPSASLEVSILFNSNNNSGMLRRPFIVCDGFDPGDIRDYYLTDKDESKTSKDNDYRGLLQLINGDISPWYENANPNVNLISALQNDGYDIVIVNFLKGAASIIENGKVFKGFLNDIINNQLRDNKTEEAVVVGPSMGGLITRYAITSLEAENVDAFVKCWISFDSPQKGAYIPLGLQHTANVMSFIQSGGIKQLYDARNTFSSSIRKINSDAAKEMVIYHYSKTNLKTIFPANHTSFFDTLYTTLDILGFPKYSKNIGITNGGKNKLYTNNHAEIVSFKIFDWTWAHAWGNNTSGSSSIIKAARIGYSCDLSTSSQVAYENAPGGWHTGLYSLNCNPDNKYVKSESDIPYVKACFIPTVSSLGQTPTQSNIHNTWEAYTGRIQNIPNKIMTPFDIIFGMEENEEHVRISSYTRDSLISNLTRDSENLIKPVVRVGDTLIQIIAAPVAYVAKKTITFGGNNNKFIVQLNVDSLKPLTDVNAVSGKSIKFSPGFSVKAGAKFVAKIDTALDYNTTLRKATVKNVNSKAAENYSDPSPYLGRIASFTEIQGVSSKDEVNSDNVSFTIYPNPVLSTVEVNYSGIGDNIIEIQVFEISGDKLFSKTFNNTGHATINMNSYNNGFYIIKLNYGKKSKLIKVLKQ